MMERAQEAVKEHIGPVEMTVNSAVPGAEAAQRWEQRAAALTAWLLAEWQQAQQEAA